ncbi:MAG: SpoIIE family protein phosphatase, partial [Candidatus Dormibacteraeota bacterium]|nr:SpoIIE family protein phosphatase [Candidatus Dormibacteraeota bacterium]
MPWVIVLVAIVMATLATGILIRNSVAASFDTSERVRTATALLFGAVKAQLDEETGLRGYLVTGDSAFLAPFRSARAELPSIFSRLSAALEELNLPAAVGAVSDAQRANAEWLSLVATPLLSRNARDALTVQQLGKSLVDRFRVDRAIVEQQLALRNDSLRDAFQANLARLILAVSGAALLIFVVGLSFALLTAQAWRRLDSARTQREAASIRERSLQLAYESKKQVADTLQEAFSQRLLPTTPLLKFSATYVPASEAELVGGDWYDVFELGADRSLFAIGDIAGHGLEAAVTMTRVREEVLAAALVDANVESILTRVNRGLVSDNTFRSMVTAVVGVADARACQFEYATAGHPPPVLAEPGRNPRLLDFGGLPLGVSETPFYRTRRIKT